MDKVRPIFEALHFSETQIALQKPEALLERIVLASTNPGDLVLDPFCGSGTTGVAALRHGRKFIGIDMDESYLEGIARKRLEAELQGAKQADFWGKIDGIMAKGV